MAASDKESRECKLPLRSLASKNSGKDFAYWVTGVFTGDLPKVVVEGGNLTFDDIINAFNAAGMAVTCSSGTSGRRRAQGWAERRTA
jgi:hypothetical protein